MRGQTGCRTGKLIQPTKLALQEQIARVAPHLRLNGHLDNSLRFPFLEVTTPLMFLNSSSPRGRS